MKIHYLNIFAVLLSITSIHIDASLAMQRPNPDNESSEQERPNKRRRLDIAGNSQDSANSALPERVTAEAIQTPAIATTNSFTWASEYPEWIKVQDAIWQYKIDPSSDPYDLEFFADYTLEHVNEDYEDYENLAYEEGESGPEDNETSADMVIDPTTTPKEHIWSRTSADWLDLPQDVWQREILPLLNLYDLGRFEIVSEGCKALCANDYLWTKLGKVIKEDYAPNYPFDRYTIKRHLTRVMLSILPDDAKAKKFITLNPDQLPFSPTNFINYMTQLTCSVFEYNTRIRVMGVTAYFLNPFFEIYGTHLMLLGDIGWFRQLQDKGLLTDAVASEIRHSNSKQPYSVLDLWTKKRHTGAFLANLERLDNASDEYKRDWKGAKDFIEELAGAHNTVGLRLKYEGLVNGWYGYDKDQNAAIEFLEHLVDERNEWACEATLDYIEIIPKLRDGSLSNWHLW